MRDTFAGIVLGAGLTAFAFVGWQTQPVAHGQTTQDVVNRNADNTVVMTVPTGEAGQRVIVFDKNTYTLAVYDVDTLGGRIALRSVRQVQWDMGLEDFNSLPPKPAEVRAMMAK